MLKLKGPNISDEEWLPMMRTCMQVVEILKPLDKRLQEGALVTAAAWYGIKLERKENGSSEGK